MEELKSREAEKDDSDDLFDKPDEIEDEARIASDLINFGMTNNEDLVADEKKVYKKAKKLASYK